MEFYLLNESLTWRKARSRRAVTFLRIIAYAVIAESILWCFLTFFVKKYILTAALAVLMTCGFFALFLIRKNRLLWSKFLLLFSCTGYLLFVCIFASGYGINQGSAHFGFILLALAAYFMLADQKFYREIIPILFLVLFFCFHFGYAPFYPAMVLPPDKAFVIQRVDVATVLISIFFITRYFVIEINKSEKALAVSADQMEGLISSIMPENVLQRIRKDGKTFADQFNDCSILFADIISFTSWSEKHTPYEVVEHLNNIFSRFDTAVENRNLTKIKTMGDAYMVASGIPVYREDHAVALTELALELQQIAANYGQFQFRIGINSGPVVAGIIGKKTFLFDVWGDTVNVASRMETGALPGKVCISLATYEKIKEKFSCTHLGKIPAKNRGEMEVYSVEGKKEDGIM